MTDPVVLPLEAVLGAFGALGTAIVVLWTRLSRTNANMRGNDVAIRKWLQRELKTCQDSTARLYDVVANLYAGSCSAECVMRERQEWPPDIERRRSNVGSPFGTDRRARPDYFQYPVNFHTEDENDG